MLGNLKDSSRVFSVWNSRHYPSGQEVVHQSLLLLGEVGVVDLIAVHAFYGFAVRFISSSPASMGE